MIQFRSIACSNQGVLRYVYAFQVPPIAIDAYGVRELVPQLWRDEHLQVRDRAAAIPRVGDVPTIPSPVTTLIKAGKSMQKVAYSHIFFINFEFVFVFYTVLLPSGVLYTVSPAFNCTLAQRIAGVGHT